ncbi:MAG: DNA recombination protein RmuC [bacterium]
MIDTLVTHLQNASPMPLFWALLGWGLAVCLLGFWLWEQRARKQLDLLRQEQKIELTKLTARCQEIDSLRDAHAFDKQRADRLEQERAAMEARLQEREKAIVEARQRMENDFQAIASRMLGQTHESFLERANETFAKHHQTAMAAAEEKHKAVDELIKPMRETLTRYEKGLSDLREQNKETQGQLNSRIVDLAKQASDVKAEAAKLATALKTGSRTRGQWGEESLRNIVEMTGMSAYADFEEQVHLQEGDSAKRPDMVVRLPGKRVIAVDSKVSLNAFLDAAEAVDDAARSVLMAKHSEEIRTHVRSLAAKDYSASLRKEGSLDFVVMYIPGDNFLAAAMEARPSLFQEAFDKGVLLATPTTLIAILKSIAYGWRQEKSTEHAVKVAEMAKDLYTALRRMGDNLSGLGKSLEQTVKRYNTTIGTIEGRVMPKARRFAEYEMPGTEEPIAQIEVIDNDAREVRPDRDLLLSSYDNERDQIAE